MIYIRLTEVIRDALSTVPRGHLVFHSIVRKLESLLGRVFINTEGLGGTSVVFGRPESTAVVARVVKVGFDGSLLLLLIELLHLNESCKGSGGHTR